MRIDGWISSIPARRMCQSRGLGTLSQPWPSSRSGCSSDSRSRLSHPAVRSKSSSPGTSRTSWGSPSWTSSSARCRASQAPCRGAPRRGLPPGRRPPRAQHDAGSQGRLLARDGQSRRRGGRAQRHQEARQVRGAGSKAGDKKKEKKPSGRAAAVVAKPSVGKKADGP